MKAIIKILIANRGEIAVRIIRACREMGIATVAVYSEADRQAMHVRMADEAVLLGPALAIESYLAIDRVIAAAKRAAAEAIHPGYGFLSENADFAKAVADAGLIFVGPRPASIRAMGDKEEARARMKARNVPIVPGFQGSDDDAALTDAADRLGYPVLIKAAAGGGGKAMRVVSAPAELGESLQAARREAVNAFGDPRVFLERYIPSARHIEFQVLADTHGNIVHLNERECSVQRRHQKIIEETPSPLLDDFLREKMGQAAVEAAQAVEYENAGTVEFIVDPATRAFYFLEMNTRLQVEHPITEVTTGIDLVQWQIRIAAGETLPFKQQDISSRGHALECRVYAEDPANQFLPSTGCLLKVVEPKGPEIRVDAGVESGDEVTVYYDPMLSKVIVHAETRQAAIQKMRVALENHALLGVTTNIGLLQAILAHPDFQTAQVTTTFVEHHLSELKTDNSIYIPQALIAGALTELLTPSGASPAADASDDPHSPWARGEAFRIGGTRN